MKARGRNIEVYTVGFLVVEIRGAGTSCRAVPRMHRTSTSPQRDALKAAFRDIALKIFQAATYQLSRLARGSWVPIGSRSGHTAPWKVADASALVWWFRSSLHPLRLGCEGNF